jgi:hypothetical protein
MIHLLAILVILPAAGLVVFDLGSRNRAAGALTFGWFLLGSALAFTPFYTDHFKDFPPLPVKFSAGWLAILILSFCFKPIQKLWDSIPTGRLVLWHWARAPIGLCFILAAARGELAPQFGQRAGWGDLLSGLFALAYAASPLLRTKGLTLLWTLFGAADLLTAVGTAAVTVNSPIQIYPYGDQMRMMLDFPFLMIPILFVPTLLFTHGLILARVLRAKSGWSYPIKED